MAINRSDLIRSVVQLFLLAAAIAGVLYGRWSLSMVALATLALSFAPLFVARWVGIRLPGSFLTAIALFCFATIFLGEVYDFYERYWWWDIALHFGSAVSFGLFGFLFIFMLFEGNRYAAPPWAVAFLSYCVAVSVGASWEILEFVMDQLFGLNMQKSGLVDTMYDLIVDTGGAALGGLTGFFYLKGKELGGLGGAIAEFVALNMKIYSKISRKR